MQNCPDVLRRQYANADKLQLRQAFQARYSCNKQGFGPWICSHYRLQEGMRLLEVGCGTGNMWIGLPLPAGASLTLTDFSPGMLAEAQRNLQGREDITFQIADVQYLPYANACFDAVIANMMLYHVPDLHKALAELRRVLKPGGCLYCATYGEHSAVETAALWLGVNAAQRHTFTLQNGEAALKQHFSHVVKDLYDDAFCITRAEDLADYLLSLPSMSMLTTYPREEICRVLAQHMEDGIIRLPKDYGLFICT